ncbi:protein sel-1 homolog 1 isoform X2 [Plutella xylostella]|uniref:protein sel-1 homolog 1 isoform X2 n=1 Tax=Plutella xylostella TaxID=51655 RepID=UPI00203302A3|nr:protein sel-1 homolog 1 isoform X2 [Plutella xylostella]
MRLKLLVLLLCVAFSVAEILGPDAAQSESKTEEEEDDDDPLVTTKKDIDADEYLKNLNKVVSEQIKQFNEYVGTREPLDKDSLSTEEYLEKSAKILEQMKERMDQQAGWVDTMLDLKEPSLKGLDSLQPAPEEQPELTPEEQEAAALYSAGMSLLNRRSSDVTAAIALIQQAAARGSAPARLALAWARVYGEGGAVDVEAARREFEELVKEGHADAHSGLGFMYATGTGVPVSQARALVHYTAGALAGSTYSQMALAYRYWAGHTLRASCHDALTLYMKVAAKVASSVSLSGGPAIQRVRLLEEAEGGAGGTLDTDLIEYYQLLAEKGDVQAQVGLGQLHFQGGRGVTLDASKALHYFQHAAAAGNAVAHAFLGKIYLEGGDGIKADNETALRYFKKAAELNNPVGQSGLGIMYLQGRGVPKDPSAAFKYFTMAANQGWVEGQLHLGFMYFGGIGVRRDFKQANKYFSLASQSGHVLAFYHLAHMHAQGLGVARSCTTAVELFKNVCERGQWGARLMAAHGAWRARDALSSFHQYLALAEQGYEAAQTNAAYLLDNGEVTHFPEPERWRRALQLWSRAAAQGYSPARVKLGDYHYYGLGTVADLEAAAHHYRIASEQQHNAQATFNLGYMHSLGLGLTRDLHLAKRCFDLAADTAPDARLPSALALAALGTATTLYSAHKNLLQSPLGVMFLSGDSLFLSNWDLYLITALLGALGVVVYLRRPQPAQ